MIISYYLSCSLFPHLHLSLYSHIIEFSFAHTHPHTDASLVTYLIAIAVTNPAKIIIIISLICFTVIMKWRY